MQTPGYPVAYVGNIGFDVHSSELRKLFEDCNVTKVRLHTDKDTGKSKGFAHIHFADDECLDRWALLSSRLIAWNSVAKQTSHWVFAGQCLMMALSLGGAESRLAMLNPRRCNEKVMAFGCQLDNAPCPFIQEDNMIKQKTGNCHFIGKGYLTLCACLHAQRLKMLWQMCKQSASYASFSFCCAHSTYLSIRPRIRWPS